VSRPPIKACLALCGLLLTLHSLAAQNVPAEVGLRMIVVGSADEAERIRAALVGGADFAAIAREYGEDGTAKTGGDLGRFKRGMMVKAFEEAAFRLSVGEVSGIVETDFGYHLVKRTE
jgi:parvulin-like peptidyl-prolyl isomerase